MESQQPSDENYEDACRRHISDAEKNVAVQGVFMPVFMSELVFNLFGIHFPAYEQANAETSEGHQDIA